MAFALSGPTAISIKQGESASAAYQAVRTSKPYRQVSFSVLGLPPGITGSFSPVSGTPTVITTLRLTASFTSAVGNFSIQVVARDAKSTKTIGVIVSNYLNRPFDAVKAFPTAEGFGAEETIHGRGGTAAFVDNLNDSGAGSLRTALSGAGPKFIIFRTSGTITLSSNLTIDNYTYIAAHTSPGGIQLKFVGGSPLYILDNKHDIVIRHLRIRPGASTTAGGQLALAAPYSPSTRSYNIIVDHCSIYWTADDTTNSYGICDNVTWQWNLIAESCTSVANQIGKGIIIGSGRPKGTWHHNLYAHIAMRTPLNQRSEIIDWRNNVVYNWGSDSSPNYTGSHAWQWGVPIDANPSNNNAAFGNSVNNHYLPGANSTYPGTMFLLGNGGAGEEFGGTKVYAEGNWSPQNPAGAGEEWTNGYVDFDTGFAAASQAKYRVGTPYNVPSVTTTPTASLKATVLATAGAYKPSRDSLDQGVIDDVNNTTGNIANVGAGGPWPTLSGGSYPTDTNNDGIPNTYATSHGFGVSDSIATVVAPNGYTWIENYLNELAGDTVQY
jgi:hypothetical protein